MFSTSMNTESGPNVWHNRSRIISAIYAESSLRYEMKILVIVINVRPNEFIMAVEIRPIRIVAGYNRNISVIHGPEISTVDYKSSRHRFMGNMARACGYKTLCTAALSSFLLSMCIYDLAERGNNYSQSAIVGRFRDRCRRASIMGKQHGNVNDWAGTPSSKNEGPYSVRPWYPDDRE
jgi:hypothetical protein